MISPDIRNEGAPTNAGTFVRPRGFSIGNASYFRNARYLVRAAEELRKPNEERLREFVDSGLPALKQKLLSTAPVHEASPTVRKRTISSKISSSGSGVRCSLTAMSMPSRWNTGRRWAR